jgi:hypothetical protein
MVTTAREQNWIIYSLPKQPAEELERNLRCLQDCAQSDRMFNRDLEKLSKLRQSCCKPRNMFMRGMNGRKVNAKK